MAVRGAWVLFPLVAGCGRPATEAECDEIVARIAQLELARTPGADPAEVARQVAETKTAFQSKARRQCVGKRVTESALRCVRGARSAEEIVHECLD